jgi:hypothetical protein
VGIINGINGTQHAYVGPWMIVGTGTLPASATDSQAISFGFAGGGAGNRFAQFCRQTVLTGMCMTIDSAMTTNVGTLTLQVWVAPSTAGGASVDQGTAYDLVFDPTANGDQGAAVVFANPLVVPANSRVQIRYTTTADWSATGADLNVWLEYVA